MLLKRINALGLYYSDFTYKVVLKIVKDIESIKKA